MPEAGYYWAHFKDGDKPPIEVLRRFIVYMDEVGDVWFMGNELEMTAEDRRTHGLVIEGKVEGQ